jgi:RNA polymerase sigma-70 factor, ECF subfamily
LFVGTIRLAPSTQPVTADMVETGRYSLRQLLIAGYDELARRLTRRFGSADVATEVLHETWIRLDSGTEIAAVKRPESYLYRMALNVAVDQKRVDKRWANRAALEALLRSDIERLDPEHIAAMRSEVAALDRALAEMPARRREVFTAALVEELPYREIAKRFGISLRSVEREMACAFDHCAERLKGGWEKGRIRSMGEVLRKTTMLPGDAADHQDE